MRRHQTGDLVYFEDLLMTTVALLTKVTDAIEEKLAQEQIAASYQFLLLAQKQEAERLW